MPACARFPESAGALLAAALFLSACGGTEDAGRFVMNRIEAQWANGYLTVRTDQDIRLSQEARNALVHGVPLTLELELILRDTSSQTRVGTETSSYELSYLPLSEYYQVAEIEDGLVLTFPRLRHALAHLARLELSFATGALPAGEYELMARNRLDKSRMPPPMRLPALFSSSWSHDSSWTSWPLSIDPEV